MTAISGSEQELHTAWAALLEAIPQAALATPQSLRAPVRATSLVADLEELRLELQTAIRHLHTDGAARRFVTSAWTARDVLAHLTSWMAETRRQVETIRRGEPFEYAIPYALTVFGPAEWNGREVEQRRERTVAALEEELMGELDCLETALVHMRPELLNEPRALPYAPTGNPSERWRGSLTEVVIGQCMHQRLHLARLHAHWRNRR